MDQAAPWIRAPSGSLCLTPLCIGRYRGVKHKGLGGGRKRPPSIARAQEIVPPRERKVKWRPCFRRGMVIEAIFF